MKNKKQLYRITIPNFDKYNSGLKKGHKCTLISNRFCVDAKIQALPMHTRWLYLNLLLTCGDHCSNTVETTEEQLRNMLETRQNIAKTLDHLQSFQLLTWSKIALIEENRIEVEVIGNNAAPNIVNQGGIKPSNSVVAFEDRFKNPEWIEALKVNEVDKPIFKQNISLFRETFKTVDYFNKWIQSVCSNETYRKLKAENKRVDCDRYLESAIKKEIGVAS